jgi:hypothetical protein
VMFSLPSVGENLFRGAEKKQSDNFTKNTKPKPHKTQTPTPFCRQRIEFGIKPVFSRGVCFVFDRKNDPAAGSPTATLLRLLLPLLKKCR